MEPQNGQPDNDDDDESEDDNAGASADANANANLLPNHGHPPLAQLYPNAAFQVNAHTWKSMRPIWRLWSIFCQQLQPPQPVVQPLPCVGLGLYRSASFNPGVEMVGRTMDSIDHQLVVQFFQFVEGMHDGVLFRGAVKLKTWMNCHAKMEASHYGFPVLVRFSVGNFAEVSECCRRIRTHAATFVREHRLDLQASLDLSITNDKLCGLLFEALCPTHAPIERTSVLGRFYYTRSSCGRDVSSFLYIHE
jgi:hypothetical protein